MQTHPATQRVSTHWRPAPSGKPARRSAPLSIPPATHKPHPGQKSEMTLPGLWRSHALLPAPRQDATNQVSEPNKYPAAKLPGAAAPMTFEDPKTDTTAVEAAGPANDFDQELRKRFVNGLIYDPFFIAKERELAARELTIAIDLDKTTARKDDGFNGRDFCPSYMSEGLPWVLRPTIDDVFERWHKTGLRLVLWTGGERSRVESFFREFPHMLEGFARIITKENFDIAELKYWAQRVGRHATINGVPIEDVLRRMEGYEHSPKWVSLLGHWGLIDDYDGISAMRDKSPFGPFEVRRVTPLPRGLSRWHPDAGKIGLELEDLQREILGLKRPD